MSYVAAPIPDLLIRIKNAAMARKRTVQGVTYSTFKEQVIKLLINYGFVESYSIVDAGNNKKFMSLMIKQVKDPINDIPHITIRSTPSRPWYIGAKEIKPVAGGRGI
jgi:small subunit ribosomal protein S8